MADISIEEAKAQQWILDVKNELNSVENLLTKIANTCQTIPGDDDDIMKGIEKTATNLNNVWNQMTSGFKNATNEISKAIKEIEKKADEVMSDLNDVNSRIGK